MGIARVVFSCVLLTCPSWAEIANIVVTSAASFQKGVPPGGSIASVFCTGLKGISGVVSADRYPLPLELAGVRVTINGIRAPLFSVSDLGAYQQINVQAPWEFAFASTTLVEQGEEKGTEFGSFNPSPGDFFWLLNGSGAFQHSDFSLVDTDNPGRAGETVTGYLTGLRIRPMPPIPNGQPTPMGQPSWENMMLRPSSGEPRPVWEVQFGPSNNKKLVAPSYLGLAPGLVGVYQVNFAIPEGLAEGNHQVRLIENRCIFFFGTCLVLGNPNADSVPVSMAVK